MFKAPKLTAVAQDVEATITKIMQAPVVGLRNHLIKEKPLL